MNLRDQLQAIYDDAGELKPGIVVDRARDPEHPLHNRFEWDDAVAGEKYRLQQASDLIRSVEWTYAEEPDGAPKKVRAFHSVNRVDGPTYVPAQEIKDDPFLTKLTLQSAEREWKSLHRKYAHLTQFLAIVREDVA